MSMIKINAYFECYKSIVSLNLGNAYMIMRDNTIYTSGLHKLKKGDIIIKLEFNNRIERKTYRVYYANNNNAIIEPYINELLDNIIDKIIYEETRRLDG